MLEFVHTSGASSGKDTQSRRRVRSQAMRDFRRRQRAEREAAGKSSDERLSPFDTQDSSRSPTPFDKSPRERSASRSHLTVRGATHGAGPSSRRKMAQKDFEGQFQIVGPSTHQSSSKDVSPVPLDQLTTMWTPSTDHLQFDPGLQVEFPDDFLMPEQGYSPEADDIFESEAQIQQMLAFCKSYLHWLRPSVDQDTTASLMSLAWETISCPTLLAGCFLASVGHLDAMRPDLSTENYKIYKARVLREVSERMQYPDFSPEYSDSTLGALACLLSFEISKGSCEALTHLRGLKGIVDLRRERQTENNDNTTMMLETLDLLHALMYDTPLVLVNDHVSLPTPHDMHDGARNFDGFAKLIPLLVIEQENYLQNNDMMHDDILRSFSRTLKIASACLDGSIHGTRPAYEVEGHQDLRHAFRGGLEGFRIMCDKRCPSKEPARHHLGWACYSILSIYYHLIIDGIPLRDQSNQSHVNGLINTMQLVDEDIWASLPYLRLFMFLTGAMMSSKQSLKSFLKAQLVRCTYQMGIAQWRRIRTFIQRHLHMKQILEYREQHET